MKDKACKEFNFTIVESQPVIECVTLLTEVMEEYKGLSQGGLKAVLAFFNEYYSEYIDDIVEDL